MENYNLRIGTHLEHRFDEAEQVGSDQVVLDFNQMPEVNQSGCSTLSRT